MSINQNILITALISSIATGCLILGVQSLINKKSNASTNFKQLKQDFKKQNDEELIKEQLSRNTAFFGEASINKLKNSFVIIIGVGGVGSWAFNMLLRAGVGKIRIIDFDLITLSSLNRHATATRKQVGISKVQALKDFATELMPNTQIEIINRMFEGKIASELLYGKPDFVLDCIDNIDTKVELLKYCYENEIKVISSMGAGAKSDPTRIHISDISNTFEDPLARSVRRKLKLNGILKGITTIYSSEKPGQVKLLPLDEEKVTKADEYAILPQFRSRILPVLGTLPAMFGMTMASYILCQLADYPMEPLSIKSRTGLYNNLLRDLQVREKKIYFNEEPLGLNKEEIGFLLEEIYNGKCALTENNDKLAIVRLDKDLPSKLNNLIILERKQALKYDLLEGNNEEFFGNRLKFIKDRLKLCGEILKLKVQEF
ncbi:hypothetical protein K502DRAFT_324523 [Neoconidiobolus thromboides FSU 785]|nr:hypothetical protein K502DRAFT_324523 [Neoconidiobolus thromboides FSU 785]